MSSAEPGDLLAPELGEFIVLFDVLLSEIEPSLPDIFLTPNTSTDGAPTIERGGVTYYGVPIEGSGFDRGGDGPLPQPSIKIANVQPLLSPWVSGAQDLIGATVMRTVVLAMWLDAGADPDSSAFLTRDKFEIRQKVREDRETLEFRLASVLDRAELLVPKRLAIRQCQLRYRNWTGSAFDYSSATCPYTAASLYDRFDETTVVEAEDECSRTMRGCKLRFPDSLPMSGFPGVGQR